MKYRKSFDVYPELFDTRGYCDIQGASLWRQMFPIAHYLIFGVRSKFNVFPALDSMYVSERYGVPEELAFCEYLLRGRYEGWATREERIDRRWEDFFVFLDSDIKRNHSVAVALHLYHFDQWGYFKKVLNSIENEVDIYVNIPTQEADCVSMRNRVVNDFPSAIVSVIPNHGRDVLGFMCLVSGGVFSGYDAVFKLHTKNSRVAEGWRDRLVGAILGTDEKFHRCLDLIRYQNAGLLGCNRDFVGCERSWRYNVDGVKSLAEEIGIKSEGLDEFPQFLAGSIFCVRGEVLERMRKLKISPSMWPPEAAQQDGTLGHQLERLFSVVTRDLGYSVEGLD